MAWEEIQTEKDELLNAGEYSPYNLPVPDEEGMDRILRRGIQGVKDTLKADPDPLFNQLKLVPPGGRRGRAGAGGLPTGAPESNWQELEAPPVAAKPKEKDSKYQRAIYGMERGAAGMVQSSSIQQSEGLLKLLKAVEKDPDQAQRMADLQGQAYGLEFKGGHIDPEKYLNKIREHIVKKSTSQQIRRDAMSGIPMSEALAAMGEAETFGEGWDAFTDDPVGITIEGLSQSIPAMAPGLLAALFIGPAAAPLFGATSYSVERGGMIEETMLELAEKHGHDLSTIEGQQALVDSSAFKNKMSKITSGAAAVGIADTISGIIPGIKLIKGKPIREFFAQLAVQSGLGAGGEASKQLIVEGKISAPGDVILEAILEVPGGALEIGAIRANVLEQRKIDAKATPEGDKGGGPSDNKGGETTPIPPTDETGQTIEVDADVSAEAASMKAGEVDPALSAALDEQLAAAGGTPVAPSTQPKQVDGEKITPETVGTIESPTVDETQLETKTDKVESPMIDRKTLRGQLAELSKKEPKSVKAVRKAWKGVMEALTKRFPDVKLPLPSRTFGAPAIANFFATLQEQVDLTEAMPDLKLFLETVATGNSAQVIDALNRVTNAVIADIPSATVGETGATSSQMVSGINVFDAAEEARLKKAKTVETVDKKTGKKKISKRIGGLLNRLKARAIVVDELATVVEAGINYLKENGGLELIPEGATALIRRARSYREGSQVTKRRTLPSGTVVEPKKFTGKNLDEVGGKLRELAEAIAGVVATRELNKPQTPDSKGRVEPTLSTTEAVTAPKMSRSKKPKRNPLGVKELSPKETTLTPNEAREQRKVELAKQLAEKEKQIAESKKITEPKVQTKAEKIQETSKKKAAAKKTGTKKLTKKQKETARVKAEIEQGQADLAATIKPEQKPVNELAAANVNELKHTELRRLAKHLGIPTTGSKASLIEGINAWRDNAKKVVADTKPTETVKGAKPEEVLEVEEKTVSGKQSKTELEVAGFTEGTTLPEALEESGISSKAARVIRGLVAAVKPKQRTKIIEAVNEYGSNPDKAEGIIRLIAQIADITSKQPSTDIVNALMEYGDARSQSLQEFKEDEIQSDMDADAIAEAQGISREDSDFLSDELGLATVDLSEDVDAAMSEDDFKDRNFSEGPNPDRQDRIVRGLLDDTERNRDPGPDLKEDRILFRAMNKMKDFFTSKIGGTTSINEVLETLLSGLPNNHRYHALAQRLLRLNMDIPVTIVGEGKPILDEDGKTIAMEFGFFSPGKNLSEREIQLTHIPSHDTHGELIERSLHEILHAALWHAYRINDVFRAEIDALYGEAIAEFKRRKASVGEVYSFDEIESTTVIGTLYGLKNAEEFMIEAMTNPRFQKELANIPTSSPTYYGGRLTTIMQRFKNAVNKFLGYSIRNNILDQVISAVSINLMSESEQAVAERQMKFKRGRRGITGTKLSVEGPVEPTKPTTKSREAVLDARRRVSKGVGKQIRSVLKTVRNFGNRANLMFSARDVIERNSRKLFDKGAAALAMVNPMTRYDDAKGSASGLASGIERKAVKIIRRMVKLDNKATSKLFEAMRDVTNAEIYADKPLNHPDNAHLWTTHKDGTVALKAKYAKTAPAARQLFINLAKQHPKAAKLLIDMAALTNETLAAKREGSLIAMGEGFRFEESTIKSLRKVKTDADVDALFPTTSDEDFTALRATEANTKAEKQAKKEQVALAGTNNAANKTAKAILSMTGIKGMYFSLRRYGNYVVSTSSDTKKADAYTSFHSTQEEAEAVAAALNKRGDDVRVSLKTEKNAVPKNIAAVIAEITNRVKDADTRLALRGALAETLAESVAYASQMKRYNIDGVAADDMGRAFEEYIKVSKYTIGDLVTSHRVSRALVDMRTISRNEEGTLTTDEAILAGEVVNEIAKQNKDEADERNPSGLAKAVGLIGFLNFLGAPSYWALNSTQTLTITVPYMEAIYGVKGVTALFKSYSVVFQAVYKAMASGDPSYELFISSLPPAAQKVVAELEKQTIIQSTLAHQFGTTFSPSMFKKFMDSMEEKAGKAGRVVASTPEMVMFIMEKVPEAIEHFNRISTGLAIYEVSNGDMTAVKDGVQETQFNYETSNRARGLKRWGSFAGRGLISPVMMFKTHGLGVARLLYGGMIDVVYQKGRNRKQALKLIAGLIATHTMFAGVAGGFMMYPIVMIIGLANMIFREAGDEFDLEEAAEELGRELHGEALGTLMARGIPAWLGADWSNSVNLGNLIWMGNDRADPSKPGAWAEMVYKQFGPMAQYVGNTVREGALLATDSPKGSPRDFFEAAVPVKVMRGMLQAWKYSEEGIETDGALTLVKDTDFDKWDIFVTMLGFQSSTKTDTTSWYYREQGRKMRRQERRSFLIRKMVEAIDSGESINSLIDDAIDFNLSLPPGGDTNMIIPGADMAMYRSRRRTGDRDYLKDVVTR